MKPSEIRAIKSLAFCLHDCFSSTWVIDPVTIDFAEPNPREDVHENHVVIVRGENYAALAIYRRLLFLDDYGDDLAAGLYEKIFGYVPSVCAIDLASRVFYVGRMESSGDALTLQRVGQLEHDGTALPEDFVQHLYQKRPYHFELAWSAVEPFLAGEEGWRFLRQGLLAVVSTWEQAEHMRWTAALDDFPVPPGGFP